MKNRNGLTFLIILCGCIMVSLPTLSQTISLFNGQSLEGWHIDVPDLDDNPTGEPPFIVRQSADGLLLVSLGTPRGHLITDKKYGDYKLVVEYRFANEPGNCGVLVHASTPRALYGMFPKSLEVQMQHQHAGDFWCIVEDITVPNMVERRGPEKKWGIVEGKNRRIENLTDDSENPLGEWNEMVIKCHADSIQVWVNGDLVNSGFNCTATSGQIAIQAEGSEVEFKKLELTPLQTKASKSREVTVDTGRGELSGTLLTPAGDGPFTVALIIAGSGPTDRDGNNSMMKNNSLKYLAEDLAKAGIASLRYDKRGIGGSVGAMINEADLIFDDFVKDARSWVDFLASKKQFDEIAVIGHSEGSLIGMLTAESEAVNCYVSLAGAGQPIDQVLRKQLSVQSENIYQQSCQIMDSLLAGKKVQKIPAYLNSLFRPSIQPYLMNWFQYNPQELIKELDKRVLIVQGTTDIQVGVEEAEMLKKANSEATLVVIDSMNHVFKIAPEQRLLNLNTYNEPGLQNHPDLAKYVSAFLKGYHINKGGHILRQVTHSQNTHDGYPYWSPDGSSLIYSSGTRTTCNTKKLNLNTGDQDFLTNSFAQHARYSPDGKKVVYDADYGRRIEVLDLISNEAQVFNTGSVVINNSGMPCWSPDGQKLAFTSEGKLFIQSFEESEPTLLFAHDSLVAIPFDWDEAGWIFADLRNPDNAEESDIWMISTRNKEAHPVIELKGRQVKPDLSPDGQWILFASNHAGNADLWLADRNGKNLNRLTYYEGNLTNPGYDLEASWSPDAKQIAFSSTRDDNWAIWILEPKL